eukprot:4695228-Pleurochrysis_carterae.AAC.1
MYTHFIPHTPSLGVYYVIVITRDLPGAIVRGGRGNKYMYQYRQSLVGERAQARGLGAPTRRLKEGDAYWARAGIESGFSRALGAEREHYAKMHATRVQNGKPCM